MRLRAIVAHGLADLTDLQSFSLYRSEYTRSNDTTESLLTYFDLVTLERLSNRSGAQSLRAEGYQHPRKSRLAVVTISGVLTGHRIEAPEGAAPIVLCPPAAVERVLADLPGAEVIELDLVDGAIPPLSIIDSLRAAGHASVVCEGGPSLAGQLLETGAIDEFCLATSPRIGGRPFPVTGPTAIAEREVSLVQLLRDGEDGMYARWAFRDRQAPR